MNSITTYESDDLIILVNVEFAADSGITSLIGGTVEAAAQSTTGEIVTANTVTILSATSIRVSFFENTLSEGVYALQVRATVSGVTKTVLDAYITVHGSILGDGSSGGGSTVVSVVGAVAGSSSVTGVGQSLSGANLITASVGPTNNRVFQRAADTGGAFDLGIASVPFSLTFSDAVSRLDYRVLNDGDLSPLTGWTQVGTSYPSGVNNVNVTIPARLGWMRVEFRTESSLTTVTVSDRFGVGRVIFMAGQSLAVRMFSKISDATTISALGITPNANSITYVTSQDGARDNLTPAWLIPADVSTVDSAGAAALLNDQISAFGVQCALVGHAEGATAISAWLTGGVAYAQMTDIMTAVGGWEEFVWFQGHSDSIGGTTQLDYRNRLTTLFADVTSRNSRGAAYGRVLCSIPNIAGTTWGTADQIAAIRQVQADWAAANSAAVVYPSDIALVDGTHQGQAGAVRLAAHFSRALRELAVPTITGATRLNGTDIQLSVSLPAGATSLVSVGAPASRFSVFLRGRIDSPLALDAVTPITVGTNTITLKLASSQANNVALDVWFGRGADTGSGQSNIILDNSSDGFSFGRQLLAAPRAIPAAAIAPASVAANISMAGPAYSANAGFGQSLSGGQGTTADFWTQSTTYTLEARVLKAAPNAVQVAFGQSVLGWLGVNTQGRVVARLGLAAGGDGSIGPSTESVAGTNPVIADNQWHHIAMVVTPRAQRLFVDGVLVAASTIAPLAAPTGGSGIRFFGGSTFQWDGQIDEVAVWHGERYGCLDFTAPAAPYVGDEPNLHQLWHLDGNGNTGIL